MFKPPHAPVQPCEWTPLVRSRAIGWFWFASAAGVSVLYAVALRMLEERHLRGWKYVALTLALCVAAGLWNRRKRLKEAKYRLLP